MAQAGYTPIKLYYSATTTNQPLPGDLAYGELGINITDGKLFYKDNLNAIQIIGYKLWPMTSVSGILPTANGGTNLGGATPFTANGVVYASSASALATGSVLTFNGAILGVNGVNVGRGAGAISSNTALGNNALNSNTTGILNTAIGPEALLDNTTGGENTAVGPNALRSNTTAINNTAIGSDALYSNTTGSSNVGVGRHALKGNTTGLSNTAVGTDTLRVNTTGGSNTAVGSSALNINTTGYSNTAVGALTLNANTTGYNNTAVGDGALNSNTTGDGNTAVGLFALDDNTTGIKNVGIGRQALKNNTTGSANTAINPQTNLGIYSPVFDPTTQDNRFCMGSTAVTNAYIQVAWTVVSDARDKTNFAPVPHGLAFVNQLHPTQYQFTVSRTDPTPHGPVRYGFKAQDILALEGDNPVIIDAENPEKLRYQGESLVPVLVKAIQELTARLEALEAK